MSKPFPPGIAKLRGQHREEVIARLLAMQAGDGGWKTDYKVGKAVGFANVETTCLALLALETLREGKLRILEIQPNHE